jgi:hypothetical protein
LHLVGCFLWMRDGTDHQASYYSARSFSVAADLYAGGRGCQYESYFCRLHFLRSAVLFLSFEGNVLEYNSRAESLNMSYTTLFRFLVICDIFNLQEPCILYIGRAYRYPPNVEFYIFFQQLPVLSILNMLHTLHFSLQMPFIS